MKHFNIKNKRIIFFVIFLLYKALMEVSYSKILAGSLYYPPIDFNALKYVNGLFWCVILFFTTRYELNRASNFLFFLLLVTQIVPITCFYSLCNKSSIFYNITCLALFVVSLCVGHIKILVKVLTFSKKTSKIMLFSFIVVLVLLVLNIYRRNGVPSLMALDIYKVYELRANNTLLISKYSNYILWWMMHSIVPFLLAKSIIDRKYIVSMVLVLITVFAYLYTGMKSILFSLPLTIVVSLWAKRKNVLYELFSFFMLGCCLLMFVDVFFYKEGSICDQVYQLFIRRSMLVSALNKFTYYDFFQCHTIVGWWGVFPQWLIPTSSSYDNLVLGKVISEWAYGLPEMNANTGFLAEGIMRFGIQGQFFIIIIYLILLKLADMMEKRVGQNLTLGALVYPFFLLADKLLLGELFFGNLMFVVIIMIVYRNDKPRKKLRWKSQP